MSAPGEVNPANRDPPAGLAAASGLLRRAVSFDSHFFAGAVAALGSSSMAHGITSMTSSGTTSGSPFSALKWIFPATNSRLPR